MMIPPHLLARILGRSRSLFADTVSQSQNELLQAIGSSRILVIGAGGSIGATFVKLLAPYQPSALHLVDLSENSLVTLVRDLRAEQLAPPAEFATYAVGFDEIEFYNFLRSVPRFDYILNFAALKHVRSERDPFTAMRLLRINVLANYDLLASLNSLAPGRYFCVSSDKAVNPASLMGASKAFMERVCLDQSEMIPFSSARVCERRFFRRRFAAKFLSAHRAGSTLGRPAMTCGDTLFPTKRPATVPAGVFPWSQPRSFHARLQANLALKTFSEIADDCIGGIWPLPAALRLGHQRR